MRSHLDVVSKVVQTLDFVIGCDPLNGGLKPGSGVGVLAVHPVPDLVVVTLRLHHFLHFLLDDLIAGGLSFLDWGCCLPKTHPEASSLTSQSAG